jgi:hypothetical protein
MRTQTFRGVVVSAVLGLLGMAVVGCASQMHAKAVDPSVLPKLAGSYSGYYTGAGGSANPATLRIDDKGNYTMSITQTGVSTSGTIGVDGGQLVFKRTGRTGPTQDRAFASGTLDYQEAADGSVILTGFGHDDVGPLSASFTKRK